MKIKLLHFALFLFSVSTLNALGAEINDGELAESSTGFIRISLEVGESNSVGFLQTNLDGPNSNFQNLLTHRLIEGIQRNKSTTLPLCIYSSEGGYFEISSYEAADSNGNSLQSQFGATLPINIHIGTADRTRYRAVTDNCDINSTIPITIQLNESLSSDAIGRINGRFNLLVKTE